MNFLFFLIFSGVGERVADSYNASPNSAPYLHVEFISGPAADAPPNVTISEPTDGTSVVEGTALTFAGTANDAEDGDLSASLAWSSNLDGPLGNGASVVATLSIGLHTITASVTDSGSLVGVATITVEVTVPGNTSPVVSITAPDDETTVTDRTALSFSGTANDAEDLDLTADLAWNSSLDGALTGTGGSIMATLSVGTHTITASVTDSGGLPGSDSIVVQVLPDGSLPQTLEVRITASADDAEESAGGSVKLTSSDLEMTYDKSDQTVGMRFNDIDIEPGATIIEAYVQFTVDETNSGPTTLTIKGEAANNAAAFESSASNISSRARTSETVSWVPEPWTTVGDAGSAQRTPDLSGIIAEIVNGRGWSGGNALAVIVTGSGERVAESFNGETANAPLLHISFSYSGDAVPTVSITAPANGATVSEDTELIFNANANDTEDGDLSAALVWASSVDGTLGTGNDLPAILSVGTHQITASAEDSAGQSGTDTINVSVTPSGGFPQTLDIQITTGNDDAEEKSTGSISLTSSDLELIHDKTDQTVGMRFSNVGIEPGALITNAWIQFTVDESTGGATDLLLYGEASANAPSFVKNRYNISARPGTVAQVSWQPAPWPTVGVAGPDQQTPDLSGIIAEIINGGGWLSGNALVIIVTGSGERVAESANGKPGSGAILHIEYY